MTTTRRARRIELQHHVHGAAILERTAGLQVFAFEEHLRIHARIERRRTHDGRAHDVRPDARRGSHDVGERGQIRLHSFWYSGARKCSR